MRWTLNNLVIVGLLLAPATVPGQQRPPKQPGTVVWEVGPERGVRGHVLTAALESESRVLLATVSHLYQVSDGKAEIISTPPVSDAQLVLAPGGRVYGYLVPQADSRMLFGVQIRFTDGPRVVELRQRSKEAGFLALWIGFQGRLIVTVTPLGDWQALRGPFRYTFWSADGQLLGEFDRSERANPAFDPEGAAILLMEPKSALAFDAKGNRLWEVEGQFRQAAVAASAGVALLNPSTAIRDVVVAGKNVKSARLTMETPVHHLALLPDGSTAFAASDRGTYAFFDPAKPQLALRRLPLPENPYIFDVQFLRKDAVALGVLHRSGDKGAEWPHGSYAAIDRAGKLLFARTVEVEQPATDQIDVGTLYGSPFFVGFTNSRALLARVNP